MRFSKIILLGALLFLGYSHAATIGPDTANIRIAFINGMGNNEDGALSNLSALSAAISNKQASVIDVDSVTPIKISYGLLYNPTGSLPFLSDLTTEIPYLKSTEAGRRFFDYLVGALTQKVVDGMSPQDIAKYWLWYNATKYLRENPGEVDKTANSMVRDIVADLGYYKSVIIVAHSEGNFYANKVYQKISQIVDSSTLSRLRVVSLGTPADSTPNGLYLTVEKDAIVIFTKYVSGKIGLPLPLAPNYRSNAFDWSNHSLKGTYLSDSLPTDRRKDTIIINPPINPGGTNSGYGTTWDSALKPRVLYPEPTLVQRVAQLIRAGIKKSSPSFYKRPNISDVQWVPTQNISGGAFNAGVQYSLRPQTSSLVAGYEYKISIFGGNMSGREAFWMSGLNCDYSKNKIFIGGFYGICPKCVGLVPLLSAS